MGGPNHTQAMHYRWNQRGRGRAGSARGHRGQRSKDEDAEKWNNVEEDRRGKARSGEGEGEQLRTFSTDCPLTNISRLALCIHVQCTFINSTVDNTSGPALCSPVERERRDVFDGGWTRVQTAG